MTRDVTRGRDGGPSVPAHGEHAPEVHVLPCAHAWHAAPPVPQAAGLSAVWHAPEASQQPFGQVAASQGVQAPATHEWLAGQAVPQAPQFCASVPVSVHAAPQSTWPCAH